MTRRLAAPVLALATALLACGSSEAPPGGAPEAGTAPAGGVAPAVSAPASRDFAGTYRVGGITAELDGTRPRQIQGTIVLTEAGGGYAASYQLSTQVPGPDGLPHQAVVVGRGDGTVDDRDLEGEAQTQLIVASVPGVDTDFAFAPRAATMRVRSSSHATVEPDGRIVIEIENEGAEGERYRPTRTRLTGVRIAEDAPAASPPTPEPGAMRAAQDTREEEGTR